VSKIFITGGAGFIGSHLTDLYLTNGYEVVALDDFSTGRESNIAGAMKNPRYRMIRGDVRDEALVESLVSECDLVMHLAARIGLQVVIESPLETLRSNGRGTEVVLQSAAANKKRIIIASTSEVYGLSTKIPSSESGPVAFGSPAVGRWSYACSKVYDEFLALALFREGGLPATVVRLFNTVGARQSGRYGMVLPRLVGQALSNEPLTVYGDGTQTRCFCSVHEVVHALRALAENPASIGEVINLGNPQEIRIIDLAKRVIEVTQSKSTITYREFAQVYGEGFEEIMRRVPDIAKAKRLIGFDPRRSLDDTIREVAEQQQGAASAVSPGR